MERDAARSGLLAGSDEPKEPCAECGWIGWTGGGEIERREYRLSGSADLDEARKQGLALSGVRAIGERRQRRCDRGTVL